MPDRPIDSAGDSTRDSARDPAIERVVSGATWSDFCDRLREAGQIVLGERSPADSHTRAEGFRYLTRVARAALETFVEYADPQQPELRRVIHETAKMGADNPDNHYYNAAISGAYAYRLWGTRGTVHQLSFATQIGHYGQGAGMPPSGRLEASEMALGPGGAFEIVASCARPPGVDNWLPMLPETGTLLVRQTFLDRQQERPAALSIERLDGPPGPSPVTPAAIDRGITEAGNLVLAATWLFATWAEGFQAHVNRLPRFDPAISTAFGGDPHIAYYHSYWRLAPGEALVIEATPPACPYWNFQLGNHWMESLDYRHYPIHINKHTARYRPDGSVRVIVAAEDPGVDADDNWLHTVGHDQGTMCWRWVHAEAHPEPRARVVRLEALRRAPGDA